VIYRVEFPNAIIRQHMRTLTKKGETLPKEISDIFAAAANEIATEGKKMLRDAGRVDTAELYSGIRVEYGPNPVPHTYTTADGRSITNTLGVDLKEGEVAVGVRGRHAIPIHQGYMQPNGPPIMKLVPWVLRHVKGIDKKQAKSIAWKIAQNLKGKSVPAIKYLEFPAIKQREVVRQELIKMMRRK